MKKFLGSALLIFLCLTLVIGIFVVVRNKEDDLPNSTQSGTLQESTSDTGKPNDSSSPVKPPSDNSSDAGANDPPSSVPPNDDSGDNQDNSSSEGNGGETDSGEVIPPDSSENPTPDDSGDSSQSSGGSGSDSSGNEEDDPQGDGVDYSAYIMDGLTMRPGAAVYLGDDQGATMRFTGYMTAELKSAIDEGGKEVAFLVAPIDFFDAVNPNNYAYMDWVTEFANAGKTVIYSVLEESNYYSSGNDYMVRFQLQNVMYKNINRKFVCMLAVKTAEGYKYSMYLDGTDYRSAARSMAYVVAASLNAYTMGMEEFTTDQVARLKGYINQSVDYANGKEVATDDGSMYAFTTNISASQIMQVDEMFTLITTVIPDVEIPVWYQSTDESIIRVDDYGNVTAVGKGTAVVGVYVAGESFGITVTVI